MKEQRKESRWVQSGKYNQDSVSQQKAHVQTVR